MTNNLKHIILFGTPRSGSTWLSEIICHENDLKQIHEPDNELNNVWGLYHKKGLTRFPHFKAADRDECYLELFRGALQRSVADQNDYRNKLIKKLYGLKQTKLQKNLIENGTALARHPRGLSLWLPFLRGRPSPSAHLVKTVHGLLAFPFLYEKLNFQAIILERHPLNAFSSYVKMQMPDGNRNLHLHKNLLRDLRIPLLKDSPEKYSYSFLAGFQSGVFQKQIDRLKKRYPEVHFLKYEELIEKPFQKIPALLNALELNYTEKTENFMQERFTAGEGYTTKRNLEGQSEIWRSRLSSAELEDFLQGYQSSYESVNFAL